MIDSSPADRFGVERYLTDRGQLDTFNRLMDPAGLVVGGIVTPRWLGDGASFIYKRSCPRGTEIVRVDGKTGACAPLFDLAMLRKNLRNQLRREIAEGAPEIDDICEMDDGRFCVSIDDQSFLVNPGDGSVLPGNVVAKPGGPAPLARVAQSRNAAAPRLYAKPRWIGEPWRLKEALSPDGRWFASTRDGNIVLRAAAEEREIMLTTDGSPDVAWDVESDRPRVGAGMRFLDPTPLDPWSPDARRLFAMKIDRRGVSQMPLVRYLKREEEVTMLRMQRAGGAIDIAHPHIVDTVSGTTRALDLGDTRDFYFTLIGWVSDGAEVLFARHSRDLTSVDILAGNAATGAVRTVMSEQGASFVAIWHELIFYGVTHVTIVPGGDGLIVRSARTGWNHFYHYSLDGTLRSALTEGSFAVTDVVGVDVGEGWLYFCAHDDAARPYDIHFCRVRLSGGPHERLTRLDGENWIHLAPDMSAFVSVNSRPDRPWRSDVFKADGTQLANLEVADTFRLDAICDVVCEEFKVTADDGVTELWGTMFRPGHLEPGRSYPLIDHIYAGPQITMARHHYSLGHDGFQRLDRALAQLGYIVVSIDARGTPERSKAFHDTVHGLLGAYEIRDHVAAINELIARHAFIDAARIGIWGHSWGGYFAIRGLAQAPALFKVGVASSPSTNAYEAVYYEPHLGRLPQAKAAYDRADNPSLAGSIRGKLLLTVGTSEPFIFSGTMKMARALIDAQVDHDFVIFPDGYHSYGAEDLRYFVTKLVKHFAVHLAGHADPGGPHA